MIITQKEIVKYLEEKKIFKNFRILDLKMGLSNRNYIIASGGRKYVLRTNKKKPAMFPDNLRNECRVLLFFEKAKINYVPRSIYFDEKENIHIISFLKGRHAWFKNLSKNNLEEAIRKKQKINALSEDYIKYYNRKKISLKKPNDKIVRYIQSAERKIKTINNDYPRPGTLRWVRTQLKKDYSGIKQLYDNIFLNHGDPASNLMIDRGKIYIIDWEFVRLSFDPGLANMFTHGDMDRKKEEYVIEYYAEISGLDHKKLRQETRRIHGLLLILEILKICRKYSEYYIMLNSEKVEDRKKIRRLIRKYKEIVNR